MTYHQINTALSSVGSRSKFEAIETARIRLKARVYPRCSRGFHACAFLLDGKDLPRLTLRQWRACYTLAAASLA